MGSVTSSFFDGGGGRWLENLEQVVRIGSLFLKVWTDIDDNH